MTSSIYDRTLLEVFHNTIVLNKEDVAFWTQFLIENESSFAVTVDRPYTLWLSKASFEAVIQRIASANPLHEESKESQ